MASAFIQTIEMPYAMVLTVVCSHGIQGRCVMHDCASVLSSHMLRQCSACVTQVLRHTKASIKSSKYVAACLLWDHSFDCSRKHSSECHPGGKPPNCSAKGLLHAKLASCLGVAASIELHAELVKQACMTHFKWGFAHL